MSDLTFCTDRGPVAVTLTDSRFHLAQRWETLLVGLNTTSGSLGCVSADSLRHQAEVDGTLALKTESGVCFRLTCEQVEQLLGICAARLGEDLALATVAPGPRSRLSSLAIRVLSQRLTGACA
jgi:hypothetical protein